MTPRRRAALENLRDEATINLGKGQRTKVSPRQWEMLQEGFDEKKRLGLATPALIAAAKAIGLNVD